MSKATKATSKASASRPSRLRRSLRQRGRRGGRGVSGWDMGVRLLTESGVRDVKRGPGEILAVPRFETERRAKSAQSIRRDVRLPSYSVWGRGTACREWVRGMLNISFSPSPGSFHWRLVGGRLRIGTGDTFVFAENNTRERRHDEVSCANYPGDQWRVDDENADRVGGCLVRFGARDGWPAQAQYRYPGGVGGWNGWGGTTAAGSSARGMGVFAAGAGSYNEQTAEARSINANTAMQMDQFVYQNQQRRNQQYYAHLAEEKQQVNETQATIYTRLHDHPEAADVHRGDALNVVLDELTDPSVYPQTVQAATQPIPGSAVKNIPFQYAAGAITISLDDLTAQGVPDPLLTNPRFEPDRQALRGFATQVRAAETAGTPIPAETLANMRVAIKTLEKKVAATLPIGTPDRDQSDNWLKALYGLTKMLQTPAIDKFLEGLDGNSTTTLGQVLTFMHSFNLRFGAADTAAGQATYDQLYPLLVQLRNQMNPDPRNPVTQPVGAPGTAAPQAYFGAMPTSHFDPQPDPHGGVPAPPAPGR